MNERGLPEALQKIAQQVTAGERPECSVRTILSWYQYERRSRYIVSAINRDLFRLNLGTVPHFDWTYLDGVVTFMPRGDAVREYPFGYPGEAPKTEPSSAPEAPLRDEDVSREGAHVVQDGGLAQVTPLDPTYRIGRLNVANRRPYSIAPDATVREAVTIMLKHDYSQLPVMTGERSLKGLFSWKSYGSRRSLGQEFSFVRDAMADCRKVSANDSIFYVVALIQDNDCVFVEDATGVITGIITPYDISVTFGQLGEPFLILGEIENHIRILIEGKFTKAELSEARDPAADGRKIESVADLTFGEYVRLLENPDRWDKLALALDRATFVRDLEEVRGSETT